jgi:GxxExxY protein
MNQSPEQVRTNRLSGEVLKCAFRVSNMLGAGFLEKVYENALAMELRDEGIGVVQQPRIDVLYKGRPVGQYVADMIVSGAILVEVKAIDSLTGTHESQVLNYLRGTGLRVALLLNFGKPRMQYQRIVWRF